MQALRALWTRETTNKWSAEFMLTDLVVLRLPETPVKFQGFINGKKAGVFKRRGQAQRELESMAARSWKEGQWPQS